MSTRKGRISKKNLPNKTKVFIFFVCLNNDNKIFNLVQHLVWIFINSIITKRIVITHLTSILKPRYMRFLCAFDSIFSIINLIATREISARDLFLFCLMAACLFFLLFVVITVCLFLFSLNLFIFEEKFFKK